MLVEGTFGEAGRTVVVEEFLRGEELSVLAITDGEAVWAVDHTATNLRSHGEPVELWVGDECWARGTVVRRGA